MSKVLPEVWVPIHEKPTFPEKCPCCGAKFVTIKDDSKRWNFENFADYKCGAKYSFKDQIQNHTDKWWGVCPKGSEK